MELDELRKEMDVINADMLRLLEERMALSARIAEYKRTHHMPVQDVSREEQILSDMCAGSAVLRPAYIRRFFRELFSLSRDYQKLLLGRETENERE